MSKISVAGVRGPEEGPCLGGGWDRVVPGVAILDRSPDQYPVGDAHIS